MASEPRFSPDLRDRLVELFGPDGALELMERVPQVPWHEIATRADVAATKADVAAVKADVLSTKLELAEFRVDMANQFREFGLRMTTTMVTTMLGGIFGAAGLAFAAAKFA